MTRKRESDGSRAPVGTRQPSRSSGGEERPGGPSGPILTVDRLSTRFVTEDGELTALEDVSIEILAGETVGIVGESGCGKSVLAKSIMRLNDEGITRYSGSISLKKVPLLGLDPREMRAIRGNAAAMVFQDPMNALNPLKRIGDQITESLHLHQDKGAKKNRLKAIELLRATGVPMPEQRIREYPHQLSGGLRQRVIIAIALACGPELLIADEPTTALDVTIQSQVLDLLRSLQEERQMAMMFITHDLGVVSELCSRVVVMYLGQVVESATRQDLFAKPLHPYTIGLIEAVPSESDSDAVFLPAIPGNVPSLNVIPQGCRFSSRCPLATAQCLEEPPPLWNEDVGRSVRCWRAGEIASGLRPEYSAQNDAGREEGVR